MDRARDVVRAAVLGREAAAALELLERLDELDEVALLEGRRRRVEPLADGAVARRSRACRIGGVVSDAARRTSSPPRAGMVAAAGAARRCGACGARSCPTDVCGVLDESTSRWCLVERSLVRVLDFKELEHIAPARDQHSQSTMSGYGGYEYEAQNGDAGGGGYAGGGGFLSQSGAS